MLEWCKKKCDDTSGCKGFSMSPIFTSCLPLCDSDKSNSPCREGGECDTAVPQMRCDLYNNTAPREQDSTGYLFCDGRKTVWRKTTEPEVTSTSAGCTDNRAWAEWAKPYDACIDGRWTGLEG